MTDSTHSAGAMHVDIDLVRQLAQVLDETQLSEIEVHDGERKVRVARQAVATAPVAYTPAPAPAALPATAPVAGAPAVSEPALAAAPSNAVKSPMVGTVYLSAEPGAAPFVAIGKQVAAGDTLLIVEAMKVMNPIRAPRAGSVTRILVTNGAPVEYGEPLLVIE